MKKIEKIIKNFTVAFGFVSSFSFLAGYLIFEKLRPKMIRFEAITTTEESLFNYFGIGLLLFFGFCLLSFYQIAKHLKNAKKISPFYLFLLAINVLSLIFIFGDLALLNDIGKQYRHGLSQPEWLVLYILMAFQFTFALVLTFANLFKLGKEKHLKYIARDSNIFLVAQYIGVICGLIGLFFTSLNFLFPRSLWMIKIHMMTTAAFLLLPYFLIVAYWLFVKMQEKPKGWYDEKQIQDIGRSSFLTLALSVAIMALLFFLNFNQPEGILSVLWFPFYLFLVLFLFSASNLCFSGKH